uniref:ATP-dependent Clp protease proteolytic subunit n=2 Tax=Syringa reticulata TaxID=126367 RepID=A0A8A5L3I4_9LAMI|nr:ATP-dependent Clp protease proteolytic subunit [Syringa reticulata subsp. pekinensis]QTF74169.1 ATP-dependent Clp protease proteolytic subunit [Syringa reticulata subsp. amurensis]
MPVGVPKVAYLVYGDEEPSWVDLYNRLYRQRLLFLCQEVKPEISNQIVGLMVYLSIEDKTIDQFLFINSPGGGILSGFGIYDTIQWVPPDIHTIGMGVVASMGCFILLGGTVTKRIAYPHAWVMMHQPASTFFESFTGEYVMESDEVTALRDSVTMTYVERTGKPRWVIFRDLERDVFMTPTEALAYGIIDLIGID